MVSSSIKSGPTRKTAVTNKKDSQCVCPVCCDPIEDAVGKKKGQDAVFCDGSCQEWIHRQCASLSKHAYSLVSYSDDECYCPRTDLTKAIGLLNSELSSLKARITSLETSSVSHNSETVNNSVSSSPTTMVRTVPPTNSGPIRRCHPQIGNSIWFSMAFPSVTLVPHFMSD